MSVLESTQKATVPAGDWDVDPAHSSVGFEIKHLGIATVRGQFEEFSGSVDASGSEPVVAGTVKAASVTTHDPDRDQHLSSPEFFDVERYPEISFRSSAFSASDEGAVIVRGELEMKGQRKEVELAGILTGPAEDPWGNQRLGLSLETVVNRHDFGVSWNAAVPGGGMLLPDDVKLLLDFSLIKAGEGPAEDAGEEAGV